MAFLQVHERVARRVNKSSVPCSVPGCPNHVEHWHHVVYRCNGGDVVTGLCKQHHIEHHSKQGDFSQWGAQGGHKTQAEHPEVRQNLKQYRK